MALGDVRIARTVAALCAAGLTANRRFAPATRT